MNWKCRECGKEAEGTRDELVDRGWCHLNIGGKGDEKFPEYIEEEENDDVISASWCPNCKSTEKTTDFMREVIVAEAV